MDYEEMNTKDMELGVALYDAIGGLADKDPGDEMRIQEMADFFNDYPDAVDVLKRVSRSNTNPNVKNIDHLNAFVLLHKKKLNILDSLDEINNELKYYG